MTKYKSIFTEVPTPNTYTYNLHLNNNKYTGKSDIVF